VYAECSLGLSHPARSRKYVARALRLIAEVARTEGRSEDAERALSQSLGVVRAIRHPTETWQTELALARLRTAAGRRDDGAAMLATARQSIERLGAAVRDPRLRAGLRDGPRIRRTLETWPVE
jgi:hypothetical protein